jgi:hypothetical protein
MEEQLIMRTKQKIFYLLMLNLSLLAILISFAYCEATILNEQVTLNTANPTKNYFFDLTAGDTISIRLDVTGDLMNFHIFNSTDGQLFNKNNIGNEVVQEQWAVPYNGRFEFHIETTGNEASITITLTSANPQGQVGAGGVDPTPMIIIGVIVGVVIIMILILRMKTHAALPPPPQIPPPPPPPPS